MGLIKNLWLNTVLIQRILMSNLYVLVLKLVCWIQRFSVKSNFFQLKLVALLETKLAIGSKSSYPVNSAVSLFSSLTSTKESWFIICKVTCKKGRNSGTDLRDCLFESYDRIARGTRQKRDQKATTISLYIFFSRFHDAGKFFTPCRLGGIPLVQGRIPD